jgi:outer membrane protein TolC
MRSSVARPPRRIVGVIGQVSALILAGMTTAQAQAVPRQPPPPSAPGPSNQRPPDPATRPPQTPTTPPATPGAGAQVKPVGEGAAPEAPPVLNFSPDGLSLEEALRLTLRHEPNIQLSAASADRLAGFAQEQAGVFDTTITGGIEYSYRVQELTEARKQDERNKRERLDEFIRTAGPDTEATAQTVTLLRQILGLPPGSEAQQIAELERLSPNLAAQVKVLNALIASTPAQADQLRTIRNDFLRTAGDQFDRSLVDQRETLRRARLNREDLGDAPDDEVFKNTRAKLQFSKLFHNGIQVAPFVDFSAEGSNFKGKERKAEFGGKGINDLYTTRVGSDFLLPLMRGRGGDAIAAGERAATIEAQAGTLDVEHQRATSVLRTAQAYWELRAAQESLAILERSATRQGDLLKSTTALVNGGELARVELARSQAGEARARSRVLDARQRLYDARVELAAALGVATNGNETTLPTAAKDPFPAAPDAASLQPWIGATATAGQRRDLEAAQRREEAAVILQRNAVTELQPRLDLAASLFYTALGEVGDVATEDFDLDGRPVYRRDGFGEAFDRWVGPSFTLSLQYEKPMGNNGAKGRLAAREAERRTRAIETADLRRQVRLGVGRTAAALFETIGRLQQTQAASKYYDQTITGELSRFRAGEATLINTIQTEQQATETDLANIAAQQAVANLLAELRFESGTLVQNSTVSAPTLVSLPPAAGRTR